MRRLDRGIVLALLVGVVVGLVVSGSLDLMNRTAADEKADRARLGKDLAEITKGAQAFTQAFPALVKLVRPSVVTIYTEKKLKPAHKQPQVPKEYRRYFDREMPWWFRDMPKDWFEFRNPDDLQMRGQGSGVIVDEQGHILTNNHVVKGMDAGEIKVKLHDGREYVAKIIATDPKTDLAVIKIEAENLIPAEFGDSQALEVGEWVLSVGSPFGFEQSVSAGIISAKARKNVIRTSPTQLMQEDFLQTDAGVNPGNSGGPLVNLRGQVVGICTAIASRSRGDDRVGFAVPSHIATTVMRQLIDKKKVTRGYLGVMMFGVNDDEAAKSQRFESALDLRKKLNLTQKDGVYVAQVMANSPAAKAGILPEDVIIEFNGQKITDGNCLSDIVRATEVGKSVKVAIVRGGKPMDLNVKVEEQPADREDVATAAEEEGEEHEETDLGVTVSEVTPELAKKYKVEGEKGVLVTEVGQDSPAYGALREGDVIQKINGKDIASVAEFKDAIRAFDKGEMITLIVRNDDGVRVVRMKQNKE